MVRPRCEQRDRNPPEFDRVHRAGIGVVVLVVRAVHGEDHLVRQAGEHCIAEREEADGEEWTTGEKFSLRTRIPRVGMARCKPVKTSTNTHTLPCSLQSPGRRRQGTQLQVTMHLPPLLSPSLSCPKIPVHKQNLTSGSYNLQQCITYHHNQLPTTPPIQSQFGGPITFHPHL